MTYVQFPIKSDLDRLSYDEYREKSSLFSETWLAATLGFAGFFTFAGRNVAMRKPYYSGIQKLLIYIPVGVYAGIYLRDRQREKSRQKWAAHKHYIELHPEDFPPYPRPVKVGETLEAWLPFRSGW